MNWKNKASDCLRAGLLVGLAAAPACAQFDASGGAYGYLALALAVPVTTASTTTTASSPVQNIASVPAATVSGLSTAVTVPAVQTDRAFVVCSQTANSSRATNMATCRLTSSTEVTVDTYEVNGQTVSIFVVEFASGASVQRGSYSFGAGESSVNIALASSVSTSRSFVILTSRINSVLTNIDQRRMFRGVLSDANTLTLARGETGTAADVEWQVVELQAAVVQSGETALTAGTASTATISAVDPAKSFVVANASGDATVAGVENRAYIRAGLADATTLRFDRAGSTGNMNIAWFVVSMSDNTRVQAGTISVNAAYSNTPALTASLSSVNTSRTIVLGSADIQEAGNPTSSSDQDSGNYHLNLTDATTVSVTRQSAEASRTGTVAYQAVEFP